MRTPHLEGARRRSRLVTLMVLCGCLAAALASLLTGTFRITPSAAWQALWGGGSALDQQIIVGQRLPRLVAALTVGAALGMAGATFQTLSRNPLGSPDILGFTTGSATGALVAALATGQDGSPGIGMGAGALMGGLMTVCLVLAINHSQVGVGDRIILVGISLGAMLGSANDYLLTRADLEAAESAKTWLYGSLHGVGWQTVRIPALAICVLMAVMALGRPTIQALELGDDRAGSLGVDVRRATRRLMLGAVLLTAAGTAVAGPIGFLALAAPQLAHRLWRSAGLELWQSALLGAVLLCLADFVAARALSPFQIPVGLVTGALGGGYLVWMLWHQRL